MDSAIAYFMTTLHHVQGQRIDFGLWLQLFAFGTFCALFPIGKSNFQTIAHAYAHMHPQKGREVWERETEQKLTPKSQTLSAK